MHKSMLRGLVFARLVLTARATLKDPSNDPRVSFLFYRDPGDVAPGCYTFIKRSRRYGGGYTQVGAAAADLEDCSVILKTGRVLFGHALFLMPPIMAAKVKEGFGFREIDPDAPVPPEPDFDPDWFAELDQRLEKLKRSEPFPLKEGRAGIPGVRFSDRVIARDLIGGTHWLITHVF